MTPGESFCPGMKRFQGSHFVLGWNDSRRVILSWDGTTPGDSFNPGMELLQGSHSILGWNDSRGVIHCFCGERFYSPCFFAFSGVQAALWHVQLALKAREETVLTTILYMPFDVVY